MKKFQIWKEQFVLEIMAVYTIKILISHADMKFNFHTINTKTLKCSEKKKNLLYT